MKYSLIIHDLTAESLPQILAKLNGTTAHIVEADEVGVVDGRPTDADGIIWDGRIHASTKTKTKDLRWKRAKNISDEVFEAVKAELRSLTPPPQQLTPTAPTAFAGAPVTQQPLTPTMSAPTAHAPIAQTFVPNAAPAAPVAQPTATQVQAFDPNDRSFNAFTQKMGRLYSRQLVTPDYPNSLVSRINTDWSPYGKQITTITDISNDADLLAYVWKILDVDGFGAV